MRICKICKNKGNSLSEIHQQYIKDNNFTNMCSICDKKANYKSTIPCSLCKHLIHKKCSKVKDKYLNIEILKNCAACLEEIFPFQNCSHNEIISETQYTDNIDLDLDIDSLRSKYNFSHLLNETKEKDEDPIYS